MSVLGFFEDVKEGLVTEVPLDKEYKILIDMYERFGYIMRGAESYALTPKGEKYLLELRELPSILAAGFVEGSGDEIDG